MRLNPIVLALTLIVGVGGLILAIRAFSTYSDAAEAFTHVELAYLPNSFEWQDAEYDEAIATFRVVNDSQFPATVETFNIALRFDSDFAGSDYSTWVPMRVPANQSREISMSFEVTTNSIQHEGGDSQLNFTGQMLVRFARFEQPLSFRFRGSMGQVDYVGSE